MKKYKVYSQSYDFRKPPYALIMEDMNSQALDMIHSVTASDKKRRMSNVSKLIMNQMYQGHTPFKAKNKPGKN